MDKLFRTFWLVFFSIMSFSFPSPGSAQHHGSSKEELIPPVQASENQEEKSVGKHIQLVGIGSVEEVISGDPKLTTQSVKLNPYLAGFEAGSPVSAQTIGEFISFNGWGYTRSTGAENRGKLLTGRNVFTNGAVFVAKGSEPLQKLRMKSLSLAELCQKSVSSVGGAAFFVGTLDLEVLEGTGITAPPVSQEDLFENKEKYYANGNWKKEDVFVAVVGCAAVLSNESPKLVDELGVVLYNNPNEPAGNLVLHVHALELKKPVNRIVDVKPEHAVNVHHLFGKTKIRQANISVFKIGGVKQLTLPKNEIKKN